MTVVAPVGRAESTSVPCPQRGSVVVLPLLRFVVSGIRQLDVGGDLYAVRCLSG